MSAFFTTKMSEEQYIRSFKESYQRYKNSGFISEMLSGTNIDEVGVDGKEITFDLKAHFLNQTWLDEYMLDDFQDNDDFIAKYFKDEFTIDDYFNRNPEYMNTPLFMYLFLDDKQLQYFLDYINDNLEEETLLDGDPEYWESLKKCTEKLIDAKKTGLNVCYRLF